VDNRKKFIDSFVDILQNLGKNMESIFLHLHN